MNEPNLEVNITHVLQLLGEKEVELRLTRNLLAQANEKIKELSVKEAEVKKP